LISTASTSAREGPTSSSWTCAWDTAPLQGPHGSSCSAIFNVTNRANFSTPSGNVQASNLAAFLNLTSTLQGNSNPRLLQLGARFAF
jgi:hypothetical protein